MKLDDVDVNTIVAELKRMDFHATHHHGAIGSNAKLHEGWQASSIMRVATHRIRHICDEEKHVRTSIDDIHASPISQSFRHPYCRILPLAFMASVLGQWRKTRSSLRYEYHAVTMMCRSQEKHT